MKVIGFQSDEQVLVSMSVEELGELTGHTGSDLGKAFGFEMYYGSEIRSIEAKQKTIAVMDYPVSTIYKEARETLSAYEELRSKFESIRNQLSTLMQRMVALKPEREAKKA